jgi:hypothetical protein
MSNRNSAQDPSENAPNFLAPLSVYMVGIRWMNLEVSLEGVMS